MRNLIVTTILILMLSPLFGEIEPKYYQEDQQSADEELTITIIDVDTSLCLSCREQEVTLDATVTTVARTKTGLNPGDTIIIKYTHYNPPEEWVGPRPIPILTEGDIYPAFLNHSDKGHYYPAAGGYSFSPLIDYLTDDQ